MNPKPWYLSKAVLGGLVAVVAGLFGLDIGDDMQVNVVEHIDSVVGVAGGALAIYGRLKATGSIKF